MKWSWWILAVIPVAWFLQNVIHEGSHALEGRVLCGHKLMRFRPYPWPWKKWKWFIWLPERFASYEYKVTRPYTENEEKGRLVAPLWGAFFWFILVSTLFTVAFESLILPFLVCALIDICFWWRGYFWGSDQCDGKRYRNQGK